MVMYQSWHITGYDWKIKLYVYLPVFQQSCISFNLTVATQCHLFHKSRALNARFLWDSFRGTGWCSEGGTSQALNARSLRAPNLTCVPADSPPLSEIRRDRDTFGGSGCISGRWCKIVDPCPSNLYGNITTFGEARFLGTWSVRAIYACVHPVYGAGVYHIWASMISSLNWL